MKWYEKLLKVVKSVFEFIGRGIKKFFTLFDSITKLLILCYASFTVGFLVKYHLPVDVILIIVLNIVLIVKLAFELKEEIK